MSELRINDLEKAYGSNIVLKFDEWRVAEGTWWIKGGNGTGKTTLFKIIAGQTPFKGTVTLNNAILNKDPVAYRQQLSYAEAEPQYPPFITGNDLLDYYLNIRKTTRNTVAPLIEQFGMKDFMANKIEGYSSGMLKKLSLICAFTGEALLYLLDEPLITIDAAAAEVLYAQFKLLKNKGCIVLLSSHQEIDKSAMALSKAFTIEEKRLKLC